MKRVTVMTTAFAVAMGLAGAAHAEGELYIYIWSDTLSPELVEKFESETGISITTDVYDSNETLLAKLQQGGGGYDIVVPSQNFIPIMIEEGLIQEINASGLADYGNIEERWQSPPWDPGNKYTIPWQWGLTGFAVDSDVYDGDLSSYEVLFEPPEELQGKIGMFSTPDEVVPMVQIYLGVDLCNENPDEMQQVLDILETQKPHVKIYSYDGILERLVSGDVAAHQNWNSYTMRTRNEKSTIRYAFPSEGLLTWMDNLAVPESAPNYDSAVAFVEFMLKPENAALQTNYQKASNVIVGSADYVDEDIRTAPEMNPPAGSEFIFSESCSEGAINLVDRVWTKLMQ